MTLRESKCATREEDVAAFMSCSGLDPDAMTRISCSHTPRTESIPSPSHDSCKLLKLSAEYDLSNKKRVSTYSTLKLYKYITSVSVLRQMSTRSPTKGTS
jgi:hypothetical protein